MFEKSFKALKVTRWFTRKVNANEECVHCSHKYGLAFLFRSHESCVILVKKNRAKRAKNLFFETVLELAPHKSSTYVSQ